MRALALLAALALAAPVVAEPRARCGTCSLIPDGATGTSMTMSGTVTALKFTSTAGSGANGFECTTSGCRVDLGTGASDYLYSDGTNVFTNADFTVGTNVYATAVRGNTGVSNLINLHGSAGINIYAQASGNVTASVGTSGALTGAVVLAPNVNVTGVGNVGASGPDDLQTYQLPAGSLHVNGVCLRITATGTTASNANAKTVRLVMGPGPSVLVAKQLAVSIAGSWRMEAYVCRTGSNTQDYTARAWNENGTAICATTACADGATIERQFSTGTLTLTDTNALDIKVQSTTSTSNNDIVSELLVVEYL